MFPGMFLTINPIGYYINRCVYCLCVQRTCSGRRSKYTFRSLRSRDLHSAEKDKHGAITDNLEPITRYWSKTSGDTSIINSCLKSWFVKPTNAASPQTVNQLLFSNEFFVRALSFTIGFINKYLENRLWHIHYHYPSEIAIFQTNYCRQLTSWKQVRVFEQVLCWNTVWKPCNRQNNITQNFLALGDSYCSFR